MDSIAILLTSCIVVVLFALTTIKYAFVKLKKQKFEDDDSACHNFSEHYEDIRNSEKPNSSEEISNGLIKSKSLNSNELRIEKPHQLSNGTCKTDLGSECPTSLPSFDEIDSASKQYNLQCTATDLDNLYKRNDIIETERDARNRKNSKEGSIVKTKTTRIVYMNTNPTAADCLAENFIKEIETSVVPNAEKSTLIIHAVQKQTIESSKIENEKIDEFDFEEIPLPSVPENEALNDEFVSNKNLRKSKRNHLFRSLRHRLSRKHSYSLKNPHVWEAELEDKNVIQEKEDIILRCSIPEDEVRDSSRLRSNRSSASELSSLSKQSNSTYDNSTLVLESRENKVRKFFLVPPNLLENGSWKKRGRKLHIFNEHTFIAKHVSSGTCCEICKVRIPFALGKQSYQCRDCKIICHKECHVQTPTPCPKTSVYDFEFEYYRRHGTNTN